MSLWLVFELLKTSTIEYGNVSNLLYFIQYYVSKSRLLHIQLSFIDFPLLFNITLHESSTILYSYFLAHSFPKFYCERQFYNIFITSIWITCISIFLGYILRNEITESQGMHLYNLKRRIPNCFPKWVYQFTFIPAMYKNSTCSTSLPALSIFKTIFFFYGKKWLLLLWNTCSYYLPISLLGGLLIRVF